LAQEQKALQERIVIGIFFVIIDKKLSFNEKWDIIDEIKIKLAKLKIPNDILLKSEDEVEESKDDVGRITYYVLKEGVEV
jgi:hypothetical protein